MAEELVDMLTSEMPDEPPPLAPEDDHGQHVEVWRCVACPEPDKCSASSWNRVVKSSYVSDLKVRHWVFYHIKNSNLHWKTPEEAAEMAMDVDLTRVTCEIETKRAQDCSSG